MKTKILLLLTIVTFLTACESNDNENINITETDLVGTWNFTAQTYEVTTKATAQGITVNSTTYGYGKDFDMTNSFSENPNMISSEGSYTIVTTTSVAGQQDIVEEYSLDNVDGLNQGTWTLNGSVITITTTTNGQSNDYEISEFTGNKLILKTTLNESQNANGISIDVSGEMFVTLEK